MTLSPVDVILWVALPYVSIAIFVGGHIWRYRYDKFGWTTRSSQLYEKRLLRLGSPLFHFGILFVAIGHVVGVLVPASWVAALGIGEDLYHVLAVAVGAIAGFCTLTGAAILIYRRRTVGPVFSATTVNDKIMYLLLTATIVLGLARRCWATSPAPRTTTGQPSRRGSGRSSRSSRTPSSSWPHRSGSSCTCWRHGCCSLSGRSAAWCTCSRSRSATWRDRTSSIAAVTPNRVSRGEAGNASVDLGHGRAGA